MNNACPPTAIAVAQELSQCEGGNNDHFRSEEFCLLQQNQRPGFALYAESE
jgi:hypothetical protein